MKLKIKIVLLFALYCSLNLYAEEVPEKGVPGELPRAAAPLKEITSEKPGQPEKGDLPAEESPEPEDLLNMALKKDIETSDYYDLYYWVKNLGLVPGSSSEDLRKTLYTHYGLSSDSAPLTGGESDSDIIKIENAERTVYFTQSETDEEYVEFSGRVTIYIESSDKSSKNTVTADYITFNRTENSMTAVGDVEYIKTEGDTREVITGDSLTFNIENWRGVIYEGVSTQKQDETTFYYVCGEIKKSSSENLVMEEAVIQTVESYRSPYFNIDAGNLWMLGASDFVIARAWLKIGHVPVLPIPFYFHIDNDLFFNPVYKFTAREGHTIQTTTYIIGEKKPSDEDDTLSFLSKGEGTTHSYFDGLYLVQKNGAGETWSQDYLKIMLDYYSRMGFYTGIDSKLTFEGEESSSRLSLDFDFQLGFSRDINDASGNFTTFDGADFSDSAWNHSTFWKIWLPFRYSAGFTLKNQYFNATLRTVSDPYFNQDFHQRKEDFSWLTYLTEKLQEDASEGVSYARPTAGTTALPSGSLNFTKNFTPVFEDVKPFLNTVTLKPGTINLSYAQKEVGKKSVVEKVYDTFSPNYKFFYPSNLRYSGIELSLNGTIYDTEYDYSRDVETPEPDSRYVLDSPLDKPEEEGSQSPEDDEALSEESDEGKESEEESSKVPALTAPVPRGAVTYTEEKKISHRFKTEYNLSSPLDFDWIFYQGLDKPDGPLDVEYGFNDEDLKYDFSLLGSLKTSTGLFSDMFTNNATLSGTLDRQNYFSEEGQSDLINMYKGRKDSFSYSLSSSLYPFKHTVLGTRFSMTHNLSGDLYKSVYDIASKMGEYNDFVSSYNEGKDPADQLTPYASELLFFQDTGDVNKHNYVQSISEFQKTTTAAWEKDMISAHTLAYNYNYNQKYWGARLSLSQVLPPWDRKDTYNLNLNAKYAGFGLSLTQGFEYDSARPENLDDPDTSHIDYVLEDKDGNGVDDRLENNRDEWQKTDFSYTVSAGPSDKYTISHTGIYNYENETITSANITLKLSDFSFKVNTFYGNPVKWDSVNQDWVNLSGDKSLMINSLEPSYTYKLPETWFWKNRIKMNSDAGLTYKMDLQKYNLSLLKFNFKLNLDIYEFLTLTFSSGSSNKAMHLYQKKNRDLLFPGSDKETINILDDLMKSFNFFDTSQREDSNFNLDTIIIDATYKMNDWDLILKYEGFPKAGTYTEDDGTVRKQTVWGSRFSFFIQWKPLDMISVDGKYDDEKWTLKSQKK